MNTKNIENNKYRANGRNKIKDPYKPCFIFESTGLDESGWYQMTI